jgi:hypothetical protein
MRVPMYWLCLMVIAISPICTMPVSAQQRNGIITGAWLILPEVHCPVRA